MRVLVSPPFFIFLLFAFRGHDVGASELTYPPTHVARVKASMFSPSFLSFFPLSGAIGSPGKEGYLGRALFTGFQRSKPKVRRLETKWFLSLSCYSRAVWIMRVFGELD
jgi:hypothetical protein